MCVSCAKKRDHCCEICLGEKGGNDEEGVGQGDDDVEGLREREKRTVLRRRKKEEEKKSGGGKRGEEGGRESCDEGEEEDEVAGVVGGEKGAEKEKEEKELETGGRGLGMTVDTLTEGFEAHFGGGADLFGCGSSRNDARFKF